MNTINEILADIPIEGEGISRELEKDTPSESLPDKPEDQKPQEGENTPDQYKGFHEHPRWIQREKELEELKIREQENARVIAELNAFKEETSRNFKDNSIPPISDSFRELFGDNQIAWEKYYKEQQQIQAQIEQRILERQQQEKKQEQDNISKWNNWVSEEIVKLQTETGIDFTTENDVLPNGDKTNSERNALIKTILDYRPTDEQGNFDFHKGYKIYEALKGKGNPVISQERKQLADKMTKTSGEPKKKDYMTAHDLRGKSWGNII